jgi:hypothetical protein
MSFFDEIMNFSFDHNFRLGTQKTGHNFRRKSRRPKSFSAFYLLEVLYRMMYERMKSERGTCGWSLVRNSPTICICLVSNSLSDGVWSRSSSLASVELFRFKNKPPVQCFENNFKYRVGDSIFFQNVARSLLYTAM